MQEFLVVYSNDRITCCVFFEDIPFSFLYIFLLFLLPSPIEKGRTLISHSPQEGTTGKGNVVEQSHVNILEKRVCGKQTCGGKGCRTCLGTAILIQWTELPTLRCVGLRPADTPVGARAAGNGRSRSVTMGESTT